MKLLDRYAGPPAAVKAPAVFAEMLAAAGKSARGKVTSLMTAADWDDYIEGCVATIREESERQGSHVGLDQQKVLVRVETASRMVSTIVRRMLAETGTRDVDFLRMQPDEARDLGAGYTLRRRTGSQHLAFHNHEPQSGFPVDEALDADGKLFLIDATTSWESWQAAQETDHHRLVPVRDRIRQSPAGGTELHKYDVLLDDGKVQRADRMRTKRDGVHPVTLPLRDEAFALAETAFKRVKHRVMSPAVHVEESA